MDRVWIFSCGIVILMIALTGCTTPGVLSPHLSQQPAETGQAPEKPAGGTVPITPVFPTQSDAKLNSSAIPLLFTDDTWRIAQGCGWTKENISQSADLFMSSCRVRTLLDDGWEIVGMSYAIDILGNRCRTSTHPGAPADCDWCDDAGPTLRLRYHGQMEMELIADLEKGTVTGLGTTMPAGAASVSRNGSTSVVFRNGTVYYTFKNC